MFSCKQGQASGSNITKKMLWWNYLCNKYKDYYKNNCSKELFCNHFRPGWYFIRWQRFTRDPPSSVAQDSTLLKRSPLQRKVLYSIASSYEMSPKECNSKDREDKENMQCCNIHMRVRYTPVGCYPAPRRVATISRARTDGGVHMGGGCRPVVLHRRNLWRALSGALVGAHRFLRALPRALSGGLLEVSLFCPL